MFEHSTEVLLFEYSEIEEWKSISSRSATVVSDILHSRQVHLGRGNKISL